VHQAVFDEQGWKSAYCRWVVSSGISLPQATSDELRDLLCFQNPRVERLIPLSHNTTRAWIMDEFNKHQQAIIRLIAHAKGRVTISFDGWKANNDVLRNYASPEWSHSRKSPKLPQGFLGSRHWQFTSFSRAFGDKGWG
jgi:hypothetical protein